MNSAAVIYPTVNGFSSTLGYPSDSAIKFSWENVFQELFLENERANDYLPKWAELALSSSTVISSAIEVRQLSIEEKTAIVIKAREELTSNMVDLDPDIRKLVNDNFHNLLWK